MARWQGDLLMLSDWSLDGRGCHHVRRRHSRAHVQARLIEVFWRDILPGLQAETQVFPGVHSVRALRKLNAWGAEFGFNLAAG
jgi:hypothetical protein